MFVAFLLYLSHFFYFSNLLHIYRYLDALYVWASLLVYPLYHIYIRLLTVDKKFSFKKHSIFLLLPTLVFILHLIGMFFMNTGQHIDFLQNVLYGKHEAIGIQKHMLWMHYTYRVVFIAQVFYFLYSNFKLIIENKKNIKDFYSNTKTRSLYWVQIFNISLAVTSIASIIVAILGREKFSTNTLSLVFPSVIFSVMLFLIGLIGNEQDTVHTEEPLREPEKPKSSTENISATGLKNIMDNLFENEKIFKNHDLKIWDLSKMLGTNRTYVSKLINSEYNRNFCNHVNYYRVQYTKNLIQKNPTISNDQIAELSGFGSQNSLHRAFQSLEGMTLKQYRKMINED